VIHELFITDLDGIAQRPNCFADVQEGALDGVIVKGLFPRELMASVAQGVADRSDEADELTFGAMYGFPLNKSGDTRDEYLAEADTFVDVHQDLFGFDLRAFLNDVLRRGSGGRPVDVPVEEGRAYTPTTFRVMRPGLGGLKAHTGNEFTLLPAESRGMVWLKTQVRMWGALSWFAVAQTAEAGGELRVADLLWDDTPEEWKGFDQNLRDDSFFDDLPQDPMPLEEGDLIVFAGGRLWHKVSDIGGTRDRVTFGGFAALTQDDREFWYWS
jgi:hypothetical protein